MGADEVARWFFDAIYQRSTSAEVGENLLIGIATNVGFLRNP